MKYVLECIKYTEEQWAICCDLKVVALLMGLQLGYIKHMCFLCLWDSRDNSSHYVRQQWPTRNSYKIGEANIKTTPLVKCDKIILPPLHIKLGLMKSFVKTLDSKNNGYQYLHQKFPSLSKDKLRAGVFNGPHIREVMKDENFDVTLNDIEMEAWLSFKTVVGNFLGNTKSPNYVDYINNLLHSYHRMGCRMSLKLHFLHSHLDFFPDNLGDVSDEHGERFHQNIATMEQRYRVDGMNQ